MAFDLPLPGAVKKMRWKVKIRELERLETPHVTIFFKQNTWRVCLRTGAFLDGGSWNDVEERVRAAVEGNWDLLRSEWDRMYPHNPIRSSGDDDDVEA